MSSSALNLDDPAVRRILEGGGSKQDVILPGSSRRATLSQIKGDENHGIESTQYLNRGKQEVALLVRPKNSVTMVSGVVVADVYAIDGEPLKVHLFCPKCRRQLQIDQAKKAIDWRPTDASPVAGELKTVLDPDAHWLCDNLGILSVNTFLCTWELEDQMQDKGKDANVIVGGSLCKFRGVIDRNVLKEI